MNGFVFSNTLKLAKPTSFNNQSPSGPQNQQMTNNPSGQNSRPKPGVKKPL